MPALEYVKYILIDVPVFSFLCFVYSCCLTGPLTAAISLRTDVSINKAGHNRRKFVVFSYSLITDQFCRYAF
jgi:hypothetical protein